jgi:hypothetical protein
MIPCALLSIEHKTIRYSRMTLGSLLTGHAVDIAFTVAGDPHMRLWHLGWHLEARGYPRTRVQIQDVNVVEYVIQFPITADDEEFAAYLSTGSFRPWDRAGGTGIPN